MSNFGAITEPSSRTAWEDWDDIESSSMDVTIPELKFLNNVDKPKEIETLFVVEGKYLTECIKMQSQLKLELISSIPEVNLNIYKVDNSKDYVCTVQDYYLIMSSHIVELIKHFVDNCRDIVTIQTKPLTEYLTMNLSSQNCIIRTICTSVASKTKLDCPLLEQPNIISGVSAGVINLREHLQKSGIAVVCYVEHFEEYGADSIQNLLKQLNILKGGMTRPSCVLDSNLYI